MKKLLLLLLAVAVAAVGWAILRKNEPPRINFTHVKRQTLVSNLPTNGKVEPFEWQSVRAETTGLVSRVDVHEGQTVPKGAVLAGMSDPTLQADIEAADAKVAEAQANLTAAEAGGRPAEFTEIENSLARARLQLQQETTDYQALKRLAEKQAATSFEVKTAQDKIHQSELAIAGLEKRRTSLVGATEVAAAKARLRDANVALDLARRRAALSVVRTPIAGVVYGLAIRPGAYLNTGDLVANVGRMDRLRVRVYVDEPELGRISEGQPVTITWQALPGRKWQGTVERKPTSIQALGSRQVGEVLCTIENPGRDLVPGTNVDAEIRTAVVDNALVIPRETLRHDAAGDYVFVLQDASIARRPVKTATSSVTLVQVTEGLSDSDLVAMPSDTPLKSGDRVTPVVQ
ncbi:MAG TPA: efflux RND transporter periplasmic adaptor subunit [Bryobacteraceae bacterium]